MANKKIKTKDAVKETIKTFDKSAVAGERMKRAYLAAKDKAEQSAVPKDASASEYAADSIGRGTVTAARKAVREFDKTGRRSVAKTKKNVDTVRDKIKRHKEQKKERGNKESNAVPQNEQTSQKKARTDQKQSGKQQITKKKLDDSKSHTRRRAVREPSGQTRYGYKITDKKDVISHTDTRTRPRQYDMHTTVSGTQHGIYAPNADRRIHTVTQNTAVKIRQSSSSAGKKTVKTARKSIKTAEKTGKSAIKTTAASVKDAERTAKLSVGAARKALAISKTAVKKSAAGVKAAAKATAAAIKASIAGAKALVTAVLAGGWFVVAVVLIVCMIAMLVGSVFGIFFSDGDSDTGESLTSVMNELKADLDADVLELQKDAEYDVLDMSGCTVNWKETIAVYAVKVNVSADSTKDVITMDDEKKSDLQAVFADMNVLASRTETRTETDGETEVTRTYLIIETTHKTASEMADQYGFSDEQKEYLTELLSDEYDSFWASVLYGFE